MSLKSFASGLPIIGGLFDDSEEQAQEQMQQIMKLYGGVQTPNLQWDEFTPEGYQYGGDLNPEAAKASTISEDPAVRESYLGALNRMAGLADTGLSDVDNLGYDRARQVGAQQSRAGAESAMADARRRGVGGSGLEFASREIANQAGAGRGRQAAAEQAAEAAQMRALYAQAYGSGLSNLRGQDLNAGKANADILNQFNMANTTARNDAQARNLDMRQNLANANVQGRNQAFQYNQQGRNGVQQQRYQNQMQKIQGQAGAHQGMVDFYGQQGAKNQANRNAWTGAVANYLMPTGGKVKKNTTDWAGNDSAGDWSAYA